MSYCSKSQLDLFSISAPTPPEPAAPAPKPTKTTVPAAEVAERTPSPEAPVCKYLNDRAVALRYGVSRPTIWRWVKVLEGFPAPIRVSEGTTRWALGDLEAFDLTHLRSATRSETEAGK
jgi:predicted DNA-binding transcriptional regulator AlpA